MGFSTFLKFNPFANFDPSATKNRIIEVTKQNETQIKRVINISLPLINMYQPASTIVGIAFTSYDLTLLVGKTACDVKNLEGYAVLTDVVKIGYTTGTIALSILFPVVHAVGSSSYQLSLNLYQFSGHIRAGNFKEAAFEFLSVVHNLASVGLVVVGGPELLVLSLLSQAAKEITLSRHEFKSGRGLEAVANLVYAAIRIKNAVPHMEQIHRNHFGRVMAQEDLNRLFEEIIQMRRDSEDGRDQCKMPLNNDDLVDFDTLLAKYNLKNEITSLNLNYYNTNNIRFKNLVFKNVIFEEDYPIKDSRFENVTFKDCEMSNIAILHSVFEKSAFTGCNLKNAAFNWSSFNQCSFSASDLTGVSFNDTSLKATEFISSVLSEASFFEAQVDRSSITNSNLKDCLLFDTKSKFRISGGTPHEITKPVILLPFNFNSPGGYSELIDVSIKDSGGIVFKLHYKLKDLVNIDRLKQEVEISLHFYKDSPLNKTHSIAQYIIQAPWGLEIKKIRNYVAKAASYADGVAIPGGADIQPELYGKVEGPETYTESNYLRSIFEFALIDEADSKNIPTIGICRGSQIVNVFLGGTLNQDIENHDDVHYLQINADALKRKTGQIAHDILKGERVIGLSMHHQASETIGKGLDVVIEADGSPELIISEPKDGVSYPNFVLTQFHPEAYVDEHYTNKFKNNKNFFLNLIERAKLYILSRKPA